MALAEEIDIHRAGMQHCQRAVTVELAQQMHAVVAEPESVHLMPAAAQQCS